MPASCRRSPTSPAAQEPGGRRPASPSTSPVESLDTFYGAQWCPAEPADPPCSGAAELGIVDYGHRATPDVYLNAALKTQGHLELVAVLARPTFDAAFTDFQTAVGVDAQKAACKKIETILARGHADRPAVLLQLPRRATRRSSRASTRARSGRCSSRRPRKTPDTRHARADGRPIGPASPSADPG